MRDGYVGDIGDFANHGILRALCGTPEKPVERLKLGVIEYFHKPNNARQNSGHGNWIGYLKVSTDNESTYRACDSRLYDALRGLVGESLVNGTELKVDPARARLLLPVDNRYDCADLTIGKRSDWLQASIRKIGKDADLVFVNPDIGIASEKQEKNIKPTHASIDELSQIFNDGKSLIVYQDTTQGSGGSIKNRIEKLSSRLMDKLKPVRHPWAFSWSRTPLRAYLIVARTQEHQAEIEERLEKFRNSKWVKGQGPFLEIQVQKSLPS